MRALVRLITLVLGLVCAAVGVLLAVEVAWATLRPDSGFLVVDWPSLRAGLQRLTWTDTPVRVTAAIVAVVGAVLLLVGLGSGRRNISLHDPAPDVTVTTPPRSLARLAGHRAREQDGVGSASVTAGRKRVRVTVRSEFVEVGDLGDRVSDAVQEALRELPLPRTPTVSVSVRPAKER